jgi:acetylornithine deacetylase/succinyl-diaminopimelate desuccinylase-like protein
VAQETMERRVQNVERRLTAVEHILPTLATRAQTKADIEAAVAPLATRQEVRAAIETAVAPLATGEEMRAEIRAAIEAAVAPLATKAEVRAEAVETRRHFDIVAERMHEDIRMLAEGIVATQARCDTRHRDTTGTLTHYDRRLTRLEASPSKRR